MNKIAFLFPGQGAQQVGMGRRACERSASARELFDRANECLGYDLAALCMDGPAEKLNSTVYSQPALYVSSLAGLELIREDSSQTVDDCQLAAGLSLGEYTAIAFAGLMDFETGLSVVEQRGLAMQAASDAAPSGMVSVVGIEADELNELISQTRQADEVLQIANFLCPGTYAVSGARSACDRLGAAALAAGALKVTPLAVSGAFHTRYMQTAVPQLESAICQAQLTAPRIPVVMNVDGQPHTDPEQIRDLLVQQIVSPVQWEKSLRYMFQAGCDQFYEVGPGRVLRGLLKRINRKVPCQSVAV